MSDVKRLVQARVDGTLFEEFKEVREYAGKSIARLLEEFMCGMLLEEYCRRYELLRISDEEGKYWTNLDRDEEMDWYSGRIAHYRSWIGLWRKQRDDKRKQEHQDMEVAV